MAVERAAAVDGIVGIGGSSDGRTGIAAAAGIEAEGRGVCGRAAAAGVSVSTTSRNSNKGGWSVGRDDGNHMLLYIWI
jgi:hypothetical protein